MKAIRYHAYGSADVLRFEDIDVPPVGDDQILVRVKAASVNPLDYHFMHGTPYLVRAGAGLTRPKPPRLGVDVAGQVESVGRGVTAFRPGDEVFGCSGRGAFAEYVRIRESGAVVAKPAGLTFEQAASVPVAAISALQALRDKAKVQPGQRVLVNGAAGGVGTFAVQIAKAFGAEVTGVCSTRNVELVRSIGADRVVDYTREDFTGAGERYDAIIDMAGSRTLSEYRRVLTREGALVSVGGPVTGNWIAPLVGIARQFAVSRIVSQRLMSFLAKPNAEDLAVLSELLAAGNVTPVIDRTYPLSETAEAIRYLEAGHARGKVVITV
jgi:NADPH:quinone reductase-like Zn-dependent oxidoreductase